MSSAITVSELSKDFRVPKREAGLRAAIVGVLHRQFETVRAVREVSFEIAAGEIVGFLGANGAGKTTTLKMLTGLLHPTSGEAHVLGRVPACRERALLCEIALVMGQRYQLQWDLPAADSYELNKAIYGISTQAYRRTLDELTEILELGDLIRKPVRTLSLGERMRCEFAGCLLHRPTVLFLDEPTLGLDLIMARRVRDFVLAYCRRFGATVLLTSHSMADIEALCRRAIVIDAGRILFDGLISTLVGDFSQERTLRITLEEPIESLDQFAAGAVWEDRQTAIIRVTKKTLPGTVERLLKNLPVADLTIREPPIGDAIERLLRQRPDEVRR